MHFANATCDDIWKGQTEFVPGHDPRRDYRLVRGANHKGVRIELESPGVLRPRGRRPGAHPALQADVREDWSTWQASPPIEVRRPERDWEGADEPIEPSSRSAVDHPVHQLRDPDIFVEGEAAFMVYAMAGESGLAIAKLE